MPYGTNLSWQRHDNARRQSSDAAMQRSQASLSDLSRELGINPKTVAKWRKRETVEDRKTGPTQPRSTVLSEADDAMVVAFRRHTLLPLDDCLYALQPSIPHLTRSALHRSLQRHGISRLPEVDGDKPKRQRFKRYPIGFFHIDMALLQKSSGGRTLPFTRWVQATRSISAVPSALKRFMSATRIWTSAVWRSGSRDAMRSPNALRHLILASILLRA